jgi:uncharacterized protein (DUF488 family)
MDIFTIGHSNRSFALFLELLRAHRIDLLVDIRTMPRSRFNPHFNGAALQASLAEHGIDYLGLSALGGLRPPRRDSPHSGLRGGKQSYADYMDTAAFELALQQMLAAAQGKRAVYMCAEADPNHCHRSLVSDALLVRGIVPRHILGTGEALPHRLHKRAQVEGRHIRYLAAQHSLL